MLITRDLFREIQSAPLLESVLLWGPRQVGKTTLLDLLPLKSRAFLDDLTVRNQAQADPAFFLDQLSPPALIDEIQYAPNLFPEIKLRIDQQRRRDLKENVSVRSTDYYLTGSNRLLLDRNIKESLAGRCSLFVLHGLSVREINASLGDVPLRDILWKGGFPALYSGAVYDVSSYINDYILAFIEKDIAFSAGVEKLGEFQTVLRLLAARSGYFLNMSELAGLAGVDVKTIQAWVDLLERNHVIHLVPAFHTNLSKRITRMKKLFFYDTGICARLQSQSNSETLMLSAQAGGLFETLVFSEIMKTRDNFLKSWRLFNWRTKEQNEVDFILEGASSSTGEPQHIFIEAKLGIHGAKPFASDAEMLRVFSGAHRKAVVTAGGALTRLDRETVRVPIHNLGDYLLENLS